MANVRHIEAFLLSREWRDTDDGVEIVLWARAEVGPVRVRLTRQEPVMFVPRDAITWSGRRVERPLTTLDGRPVDALYFRSQRSLVEERMRLREVGDTTSLEADVKPSDRFLMERFVTSSLTIEGVPTERRGILYFDNPRISSPTKPGDSSAATTKRTTTKLSVLALDIETDGLDGPLLSVALASAEHERIFVRGDPPASALSLSPSPSLPPIAFARDEKTLLARVFAEIVALDPDVICGWNVTEFDLTFLDARARDVGLPFAIGRAGERARVLAGSTPTSVSIARVPGRVVLDGIATLKSATYSFERFTLEHVAQELLGRGKKIATATKTTAFDKVAEIRRMHAEDVGKLAEYNLEDCRLVLDIFAKADLLGFAMERARLTGLPMDRQGGSVAAFDHLYLPRVHRRGVVAPNVDSEIDFAPSPGGYVLDSTPGLYRDVLSFDFRSLYPSIIRTFKIDPLGLAQPGEDPIPGENGATFAREGAILPELITKLHEARSDAMTTGNAALSRAIKILMNSFYGVLGTPGCRFFDSRLPTSITVRGHAIIERARVFFEGKGMPVIYGDTDSVFVHFIRDQHDKNDKGAGDEDDDVAIAERGQELARELTRVLAEEILRDYRVESHLELRFESHYRRFLMPTTRGTDRGSKKRYAGTVKKPDGSSQLVVRGLEAVRRDWTPLARSVQLELFRRVFADEPFEPWLVEVAGDLAAGRIDEAQLTYCKRLRRDLDLYGAAGGGGESVVPSSGSPSSLTSSPPSSGASSSGAVSGRGVPPHVRAARMRDTHETFASEVEYVVTTRGPEPIEKRSTAPIDFDHYLQKQLAPVCDVMLTCLGTSFERIAGVQTSLF